VRVSGGIGIKERASLFQEIVEFSLLVSGAASSVGQSSCCARSLQENVSDAVKRNTLSGAELFLLFTDLLSA
jgi:hypothetical protein